MYILMISGQLLMLLTSIWMLKTWRPTDEAPGWYAAVFCSGLLIGSFAGYSLIAQVVELTPMFWFEQLALYAAYPFLAFVLVALKLNIDWPKEAWGRILLGICGIYWLCQQTHTLNYLLIASALISSLAIAALLLTKAAGVCMKQANLVLSVAVFASLIVVLNNINSNANPVVQDLANQWPLELGLGLLVAAINRGLYLRYLGMNASHTS